MGLRERQPPPPPIPDDPSAEWWRAVRFSADDVWKLLMEYGEKMPEHARKIVLDLARRSTPR